MIVCAVLAVTAVAEAHDFWLVPNAFHVAPGARIEIRGQTSSRFPTSESAVAVDRVADARVIGAATAERIRNLSIAGTSLVLQHRPAKSGQHVVAVRLHPRSVRESAEGLRRYLELEGAPDALARVDREGLLRGRDSVTRRYAKYAKTVVEIGRGGPRAFARTASHPLEFVPVTDPSTVAVGDTIRIRLLYQGAPLAGIRVHRDVVDWRGANTIAPPSARTAPPAPPGDTPAAPAEHLVTDSAGVLRLVVTRAGLWNVRTIHVVQADASSGADWDTHWASLVFLAGAGPRRGTASASVTPAHDSADVVAALEAFHAALARGDSTAAMALLASDAVILETGGVETREEYRSHHLPGDIAYAKAMTYARGPVRVMVRGDVAWASSTSTTTGEWRGKPVNSRGAELVVLTRTAAGWRIAAIHWSSRA